MNAGSRINCTNHELAATGSTCGQTSSKFSVPLKNPIVCLRGLATRGLPRSVRAESIASNLLSKTGQSNPLGVDQMQCENTSEMREIRSTTTHGRLGEQLCICQTWSSTRSGLTNNGRMDLSTVYRVYYIDVICVVNGRWKEDTVTEWGPGAKGSVLVQMEPSVKGKKVLVSDAYYGYSLVHVHSSIIIYAYDVGILSHILPNTLSSHLSNLART